MYYNEVPCGGGGGGDFSGGDPEPCSQQVVPGPDCPSDCPPFQLCLSGGGGGGSDPCDSANPPDYCSTDPDPCEQADALEDNSAFKAKMNQLLNDANNKDVENGYVLTKQDDGSFSYTHFEGTQHQASISVNQPIEGVIHSHPAGNYSIFSATDIKNIYELYEAGAIGGFNHEVQQLTKGSVVQKATGVFGSQGFSADDG